MSLIDGHMGSSRSTVSSILAGDSVSQVGEETCHACLEGVDVIAKYHDLMFHEHCLLGIRSRHRQLRKVSAASKTEDITLMKDQPLIWRPKVKKFLKPKGFGGYRTDAIREQKKVVIHSTEKRTVNTY
jgi:hypothetical protein